MLFIHISEKNNFWQGGRKPSFFLFEKNIIYFVKIVNFLFQFVKKYVILNEQK